MHCLTQALVAKILLRAKGSPVDLRIGVAKDEAGALKAHAWLEADCRPIFGGTDTQIREYSLLRQLDQA